MRTWVEWQEYLNGVEREIGDHVDPRVAYDAELEERDRRDEKGPGLRVPGARDAVLALYPDRLPSSDVTPLGRYAA